MRPRTGFAEEQAGRNENAQKALGSLNGETNVLIVSGDSKVKSIDDAKKFEAVLAAEGADTDGVIYPLIGLLRPL